MKCIEFGESGAIDSLFMSEIARPVILAHQVLVKVHAFGINRADTLQRQGKYPPPKGESNILGLEVAGTVVGLGSKVKGWKVGDSVFGLVGGGGYAEYAAIDYRHVMPCPHNISLEYCAGIAEVFLTAYQTLYFSTKIKPGSNLLIHAGASAVGLALIQLAKVENCATMATSSNTDKLALCESLGANFAVNYTEDDFVEVAMKNKVNFDLIVDFVAGDYLNRNLKILGLDGTIVYLAMLAGRYADKLDMGLLLAKRARIVGSTLRNRSDEYKSDLTSAFSKKCLPLFESGELVVNIDTVLRADQVKVAHRKLESNDTMGKIICVW